MTVAAIERTDRLAEVDDLRLGIVGAGKFGTTLARAAIAAGYDVAIAGSGPADEIALTVEVLAPGAHAATAEEVVRHADIIILAIPTHRFRELPGDLFAGKILVDAMNYWEPVDGDDPELTSAPDGTSEVVQERFPSARVVKSLNQLGYHQVEETRRASGAPDRIAMGAAGDDRLAVRTVMRLVDRLGFDPVDAGPLKNGVVLEPDGSPIATTYSAAELSELVSTPLVAGARQGRLVGGVDAQGEPVHGLARPGKAVELRHQVRHSLPELGRLRLRDAGVPDEAPELSVLEGRHRLAGGDLEVVEVPRQFVAFRTLFERDVEHSGRAAVEPFFDRPHPAGPHDLQQPGLGEHLHVVRDRALRPPEGGRQLGHRRRPLVQQAQDRVAHGMAERLDLGRRGERHSVGELVIGGSLAAGHRGIG